MAKKGKERNIQNSKMILTLTVKEGSRRIDELTMPLNKIIPHTISADAFSLDVRTKMGAALDNRKSVKLIREFLSKYA